MTDETDPRIPEIGEYVRITVRLVAVETPPPVQPPTEYIFESVSARCELRRNGRVLDELSTYNDFYGGEFGAVASAVKELRLVCERDAIGPDSEIEAVVVRITAQFRHLRTAGQNYHAPEYAAFVSKLNGMCVGLPASVEKDVWSSKRPLEVDDD